MSSNATGFLKHPIALRLAAYYSGSIGRPFSLAYDSSAPIRALEALKIDPFEDPSTSWVIQTLRHRLDTNKLGVGETLDGDFRKMVIFPLLVHLNHSCGANTAFQCDFVAGQQQGMKLFAIQETKAGEELSLSYKPGSRNLPLNQRRTTLR